MTEGKNRTTVPEELSKSWLQLPREEREELEKTWRIAERAHRDEPDEAHIDEAEDRLLNAISGRDRPPLRKLSRRTVRRFSLLVIAIAAVGAVLYLAIGRSAGDAPANKFMLLLHGEPLDRYPMEEHEKIIGEYVAWARELGRTGRFVAGNELVRGGRILSVRGGEVLEQPVERADLSGYFVIAANTMDEAVQIAADCPHLKYRGTVEIRRIGGQ